MGLVNALMQMAYPSAYYNGTNLKPGYSHSGGGGATKVYTVKGQKAKYGRWGGGKDSYSWRPATPDRHIYKLPAPKPAPKPAPPPKPKPPEPRIESGPTFVGKNSAGQGLTAAEFDLYSQQTLYGLQAASAQQLQDSVNSTSLAIQNLENEASAYVQDSESARNTYSEDAASWRTQYSTDAQERWTNFGNVMDYKATTDSQKIKGEYDVSLRKIMNAGNESVAKIQGEYSTANTRLSGEYSLASEKIRGATSRDVAQRNKEASMFGSFLGGFWS